MPEYNARIEWAGTYDDEQTGPMVGALADYHPAVGRSVGGYLEAFITLPAANLRQAVNTALLIGEDQGQVLAIEVLPTAEFDRRLGTTTAADMLSVPEVAERLGTSPQAVRKRIRAGSLPATRLGGSWAVQRTAVEEVVAAKAARRKTVPAVAARTPRG